MPEETQQVQIASISLTPTQGGGAVCSFNLLGGLIISQVIPPPTVQAFIAELMAMKKQEQQMLQVRKKVLDGHRGN